MPSLHQPCLSKPALTVAAHALLIACLWVLGPVPTAQAQNATAPSASARAIANKVVVSGTVPDEATRAAILARVRSVYGADRVVDQLGVGPLVAPPNWTQQVQSVITPELKKITQGQLRISGNVVELMGSVANEAERQTVVSDMVTALANPTYTVRNGLRVGSPGQEQLDAALANRIIEFQLGNAELTESGRRLLDELLPVLQQFSGRRFEVVGHTDSDGTRAANIALSQARANAVRDYLVRAGIPGDRIVTSGFGPDKPVADNETAEGRARNRRIEFRVLA